MNTDRLLVDTSAWILAFKSSGHEDLKAVLQEGLVQDRVATTQLIILELLQGCKTVREFACLKRQLESLHSLELARVSWEAVYQLGFSLKRAGVTVPSVDLLLACLAIQWDYVLLHHDFHFRSISNHSELRIIDFLSG